jgi:hypothetical protein
MERSGNRYKAVPSKFRQLSSRLMTALEQGRNTMEISMTDMDTPAAPDRDAVDTLTYEGTAIRQRGLMLNLTDMWRAAGGPAYRRPALWLDMEETKRFRTYARWRWSEFGGSGSEFNVALGDIKRVQPDGLVVTTKGQRGETWAHWQLALAYARYLSPPFHAWGNTVIRNAMERFGGPPRGRDGVVRYVERQFERLHLKLDYINRNAADQMFLLVSAQELMLDKRRNFSDRSRALIIAVISAEPYEGQCPCCNAAQVLTADGQPVEGAEFDHFFHRGFNRPEHGWLICKSCHNELTQGGYLVRFSRTPDFRRFQAAVIDARRRSGGKCTESLSSG